MLLAASASRLFCAELSRCLSPELCVAARVRALNYRRPQTDCPRLLFKKRKLCSGIILLGTKQLARAHCTTTATSCSGSSLAVADSPAGSPVKLGGVAGCHDARANPTLTFSWATKIFILQQKRTKTRRPYSTVPYPKETARKSVARVYLQAIEPSGLCPFPACRCFKSWITAVGHAAGRPAGTGSW